jgi:oxygen-dependent protoporphyrinogen oxidase
MQVIVDELARRLPESSIRLSSPAQSVVFDSRSRQWLVQLSDGRSLAADALCLAVPAYAAASLLRQAEEELAQSLDRIEYASTATVNLAFRRSEVAHALDGFGFVVPFIEKRSILACTFSSVKFAGRAPEGHVLLRAFVGGALQPELFELDEDQIVQCVRNDLRDLVGIKTSPLFTVIKKWRRSMPQYHVGHLELIAQIRSRMQKLSGLELAGNAYGGAGVPDCIRSGELAAKALFESLL